MPKLRKRGGGVDTGGNTPPHFFNFERIISLRLRDYCFCSTAPTSGAPKPPIGSAPSLPGRPTPPVPSIAALRKNVSDVARPHSTASLKGPPPPSARNLHLFLCLASPLLHPPTPLLFLVPRHRRHRLHRLPHYLPGAIKAATTSFPLTRRTAAPTTTSGTLLIISGRCTSPAPPPPPSSSAPSIAVQAAIRAAGQASPSSAPPPPPPSSAPLPPLAAPFPVQCADPSTRLHA
ncbi:unnamed protein product [Parascedosporium putredinis]|uniref:Uncharacterized protein n=1 Tax=Parascedosporium putredinis TaxID=1442378 RepID=A0A9P1H5S0_9PEZI|nr:unnamed protein product [Parascedosporium putredinis]CAI7998075.1 unnamed protein product [Parascedosporium putredinis]